MNYVGFGYNTVTGEIRIKSGDAEQVYKILQIGRMDVKHDLLTVEGWDGSREYIDVGRSRVTFDHVILDIPVVLSDKEWADVNAIVQTAGTAKPVPLPKPRKRTYWPHYILQGIAEAFYAGEEKRREEEAKYEYPDWY